MDRAQANTELRSLESYSAKDLLRAAWVRARWKLAETAGAGHSPLRHQEYGKALEIVVHVPGIDVRGRTDLSGGGPGYIDGYFRALLGIDGAVPCKRVFEFCSGPGYIGYALLGAGFCEELTLADVNPESVELARRTAVENGVADRVATYVADALDGIASEERWDLVVGNPPHFLPEQPPAQLPHGLDTTSIIYFDPDWEVHRKFYLRVREFMRPGGLVVMLEDGTGSTAEDFLEMIRDGGGEFVGASPELDVRGNETDNYYVISRW